MADATLEVIRDDETPADHRAERRDLAAAFRWAARLDFHEGVANHFSLAVSDDGKRFLINPYASHFALLRASELLVLDAGGSAAAAETGQVDATAWCIHGPIHRLLPHARCLLHTHMKYATVLSCLKDSNLPPIDQNTMRFFGQVAVDDDYEGMALTEAEGERLAAVLGDKRILLMGNHGVLVAGASVAEAFDDLYYFEKACETLVTAYMTGKELRVVSDAVARRTLEGWQSYLQGWKSYPNACDRHFDALKLILDRDEPDYRD